MAVPAGRGVEPASSAPLGAVLGAIGTVAVLLSLALPWRAGSVHPSDVPAAFLWDHTATSRDPSLLIFLVPLAVVMLVGTMAPRGGAVRLFSGLATLAVCGLFAYQVDRLLGTLGHAGLSGTLDTGFYLAAIGAFLVFVSGMLPSAQYRRRGVDAVNRTPPYA